MGKTEDSWGIFNVYDLAGLYILTAYCLNFKIYFKILSLFYAWEENVLIIKYPSEILWIINPAVFEVAGDNNATRVK